MIIYEQVEIIIADEGKAFDPLAKEDPDITLDEKDRIIGGLDIFIVKNVMDDVIYQKKNNKKHSHTKKFN